MMLSEALAGVLFDAALKSLNPAPASDGFILSLPAQLSPAKLAPRSALEQAFCRCLPVRLSGGFFSLLRPSGFFHIAIAALVTVSGSESVVFCRSTSGD